MHKKVIGWLRLNIYKLLGVFLALSAFSVLYFYKINTLYNPNNDFESAGKIGVSEAVDIIDFIIFAPLRFLQLGLNELSSTDGIMKLASVLCAFIALFTFYKLVSKWHTHRIAIFSTLLFATSTISLYIGRSANTEAMLLIAAPTLIWFGTWLKSKKTVWRAVIVLPGLAVLAYIPGFIFLLIILAILFRKRIKLAWRFVDDRLKLISAGVSALLLSPIFYSLTTEPSQIKSFLGIDLLVDQKFQEIAQNLSEIPVSLFYSGFDQPERWLTGTPILDVGTISLMALGIYSYIKGSHTLRVRLLALIAMFFVIFISISSQLTIVLLVPILYLFVANGIAFLFQNWFTVFPKNPIARNTGIIIVSILIAVISTYHLERYFEAWPNNPDTKSSLQQEQ